MPATRVSDDDSVDPLVRKAAAWSWRLLVITAAIVALLWIVAWGVGRVVHWVAAGFRQ